MNEREYLELLQFIRERLQQIGRSDVDALAYSVAERAEIPSQITRSYVDSVFRQFALESRMGVERAVGRIREYVATPRGTMTDIVIIPTDGGDEYRGDVVSLSAALPDRDRFLSELREFVIELSDNFGEGGE